MDRQKNPRPVSAAPAPAPHTQGGMLGGSVPPALVEFGQLVERHIMERTWRRIRQLRVEVHVGRVVVQGQTRWYYAKQLAILALQEALRDAGMTAVADVRITVTAPLGRGRYLAPV